MRPLFLIGFMAAGKTSVGRALAASTHRRFVDLDEAIGDVATKVAADEPMFRKLEAETLRLAISSDTVISTGGGAAGYGDNLARMRAAGLVVALDVDVEEAQRRAAGGPERPLMANAAELARARAPIYRRAHAVVPTTGRTLAEVIAEVGHVERVAEGDATIVALGERSYPIQIVERVQPVERTLVITDSNVGPHHLAKLGDGDWLSILPGEGSKSFAIYENVCNELVARGLDRGATLLALGGGVVGDLAGFVAATYLRGISIIQHPTTLVAMTDAAIGGKTAIDLPAGKNLVGAFHQPHRVICALDTLATLPPSERRAGFGELWKYGLLDGHELWDLVDACAAWSAGTVKQPPAELGEVIRRCIAYKAAVVGRDERERSGHRALLNLGHTVGHAIESAAGLLHGEAVALGLVAACRVSRALGFLDLEAQVVDGLRRSKLPHDLDRYLTDDVLGRLSVDKKRIGATMKFIVIREVGRCEPTAIDITELRRILRPVRSA